MGVGSEAPALEWSPSRSPPPVDPAVISPLPPAEATEEQSGAGGPRTCWGLGVGGLRMRAACAALWALGAVVPVYRRNLSIFAMFAVKRERKKDYVY